MILRISEALLFEGDSTSVSVILVNNVTLQRSLSVTVQVEPGNVAAIARRGFGSHRIFKTQIA